MCILQREAYEDYTPTNIQQPIIRRANSQPTYNLNGTQVLNPSKGVFIKNGQKAILK